jgi:hypothetical protein
MNYPQRRRKMSNYSKDEAIKELQKKLEIEKAKFDKFVEDLKNEPKDKANSAQEFLINSSCGDLVLNETLPKEEWLYVSDIMIKFVKWKIDELSSKEGKDGN